MQRKERDDPSHQQANRLLPARRLAPLFRHHSLAFDLRSYPPCGTLFTLPINTRDLLSCFSQAFMYFTLFFMFFMLPSIPFTASLRSRLA